MKKVLLSSVLGLILAANANALDITKVTDAAAKVDSAVDSAQAATAPVDAVKEMAEEKVESMTDEAKEMAEQKVEEMTDEAKEAAAAALSN